MWCICSMKLPVFCRIFSPMFPKWTLKNIWHMIIFCILCKCFKVGFVFAHHFLSVRLSVRHTGCVCVLNSSNFKTIMPKSFTSLDALLLLLLLLVFVRLTVYMFDRLSVRPSVNLNVLSLFYICNSSNVFATSFYVTSKMVVTNCYLVFFTPAIYYEAWIVGWDKQIYSLGVYIWELYVNLILFFTKST